MPFLNHYLSRLLIAVLFGASATLAFAPYSLWPFAFLAPLVLFLLLNNQQPNDRHGLVFSGG